MRAILCLLTVCIIASFLINTVSALRIDGNIEIEEWIDTSFCDIVSAGSESNCNVDYASMYSFVDKEDYSVFLAFIYTTVDFDLENNHSAVEIYTNGVYSTTMYADGRSDVNYDKFDVDFVFGFHEKFQETYCEARLGIKYGVEDTTVLGIRIYDYLGRPSNYYEITVCEPEETAVFETESTTEKESKTKKETTTIEPTVPSKSLSEYDTVPVERHSMQVQSIRAETATTAERLSETQTESTTEPQTTKEVETENSNTTLNTDSDSKLTEKVITAAAEDESESESTSEISTVLSQKEIDKVNTKKMWGYGVATFLMLGAVTVTVVMIVIKMIGKKNNELHENDF